MDSPSKRISIHYKIQIAIYLITSYNQFIEWKLLHYFLHGVQLKETIQEAAQFKVELCKSIYLLMNEIIQYVFKSFI